jgi:hypothetical protein
MAERNEWRDAPLSGDPLYGDRENLRRYRDFARDEHRRFASQYEREQQGGLRGRSDLTEYDRFDEDLTGGNFDPNRRHATQGGYAYGSFSGVTPDGRPEDYSHPADRQPRTNRGRGPRGYQRSDQRIYEDVCERLTEDDRIDASEVNVSVAAGEVTLTGTVRSRQAKRRATDIVEGVKGVKDVDNGIRVSDEQVWPPRGEGIAGRGT